MGYGMKIALHRGCYSANAVREEARSASWDGGSIWWSAQSAVARVTRNSPRRSGEMLKASGSDRVLT